MPDMHAHEGGESQPGTDPTLYWLSELSATLENTGAADNQYAAETAEPVPSPSVSLKVKDMRTPTGIVPIRVSFEATHNGEPSLEQQALRAIHEQYASDLDVQRQRLKALHPAQYADMFAYLQVYDAVAAGVRQLEDRLEGYRANITAIDAAVAEGHEMVEAVGHHAARMYDAVMEGFALLAYNQDEPLATHTAYLEAVQYEEEDLN